MEAYIYLSVGFRGKNIWEMVIIVVDKTDDNSIKNEHTSKKNEGKEPQIMDLTEQVVEMFGKLSK
ncbi:hypothetical protein GC101_18145 [Paenibacillus sp. LMG 31459]|uniref:Uncharacterized protein n=1 Tax=Paenibacillus phytohabitans TaxID=2654978 RepID=A0ABX1YID9_9BACL|nr:hypothetical protein [Paenibacillus phytohabitans]